MAQLEKLSSKESSLENEINDALKNFSAEEFALKTEILKNNKDLKERTKEEMKTYLESGELKKRLDAYIFINGNKINISSIEMDDTSGLLKMKYKITLDNAEKEFTTYLKIIGETNNSYLKFEKNPALQKEVSAIELYDDNGAKKISTKEEEYQGGKIFDVNIVKLPSKSIDIRIVENPNKTKERLIKKIQNYELKPVFTAETFKDENLENTKIETLQYTTLGKEVIEESGKYYKAIFMREGDKYREIGKVYFTTKGEIDENTTKTPQEFSLLGVKMNIKIDTKTNTFTIENIEQLKNQIKEHRKIMSEYIENSEFGDNTIFVGFNRPKGGKWLQTKLLGLQLIDDTYTFKRRGEKQPETIKFGFDNKNNLVLKDSAGKVQDNITIEIEKTNGKKEVRMITKNIENKKLLIQPTTNELIKNQEQPTLENAPTVLTKDYLYNINREKIEYHDKKGMLLSSIPASKTENNLRKLEELSEQVQAKDLYKDLKKTMTEKIFEERIKNINLLDQDVFTAFETLLNGSKLNTTSRKCVKVLDKDGIYKYYKVRQKKEGESRIFEEDKELYDEAKSIMEKILNNIAIIEKIENTRLLYKDKKEKIEKPFTQFVGGSGLLPITTQEKINFLKKIEKDKGELKKTFVRGAKTEYIQSFDITFNIKGEKITTTPKIQTINSQNYKTRLEDKENTLTLRFDDIE